ncbi:OmpA family protein [Prevotella merdae]|uniref:OmpA family protein n=1 Tax=Prevotella merdae TaxID=2079531 RepID=UPI003F7DD140
MKFKSILLSSLLALGCTAASAQEAKTVNVFNPHGYLQVQIGGQETLGEIGFGDLLSPNVQVGYGYNFNKVVGARVSLNAWQSKAGQEFLGQTYKWKWNYVAPMVDATFNLSNLFCGFNPNRLVNVGVFAGIGANIAWGNDEAATAQSNMKTAYTNLINSAYGTTTIPEANKVAKSDPALSYLWDGSKVRLTGRVGANVDFRVSERVSLGLEVSANTLNDRYNSKKAGNSDWYFNALVGAKFTLGKTYTTKTIPAPKPVEKIIERIIEKPAPAPAPKTETKQEAVDENFRRDIFFPIGNSNIAKSQTTKIAEIVTFMKENPDAKITLTGYADKGTGSAAFNDKIAARRAQTVYNTLAAKGVAKSRMIKKSMGSRVQPFEENDMNRVTICIAK